MSEAEDQWLRKWLGDVAQARGTMSQRSLSRIETAPGGVKAAKALAKKLGLHLLQLEDENGKTVVVASYRPFKVLA